MSLIVLGDSLSSMSRVDIFLQVDGSVSDAANSLAQQARTHHKAKAALDDASTSPDLAKAILQIRKSRTVGDEEGDGKEVRTSTSGSRTQRGELACLSGKLPT